MYAAADMDGRRGGLTTQSLFQMVYNQHVREGDLAFCSE